MKIILSVIVFVFISIVTSAQFNLNYTNLKCSGKIPSSLLSTTKDKYQIEKETIQKSKVSKQIKKLQSKYSIEVNFLLDNLMQEGSILFNDEISNYLNLITQNLIKNESNEIKNKIKVYTLRSTEVNAFATQRGDIFVTMGLIAKLKNESEIAFVLAHEISHYVKEHNLKMYIELNNVSKKNTKEIVLENKEEYSNSSLLKKCLFSKNQESEADSLGLIRYLQAGYEIKFISGVFDILSNYNVPLHNEAFVFEKLESNMITIPTEIKYFPVNKLDGNEDVNDDYSTHPNLAKRRKAIENLAKLSKNNQSPLLNEKEFQIINSRAQLELPMLYLQSKNYIYAAYTANILLSKYPENIYLKKCLAKALYYTAKLKNNLIPMNSSKVEFPGYGVAVYNFFEKMDKHDFNYLTLQYCWNLKNQNLNDAELTQLTTEMQNEFQKNTYNNNAEKYKNELSKLFVNEKIEEIFNSKIEEPKIEKYKKAHKKNKNIGIDSVIVMAEGYASIDNRKTAKLDYLNTENRKINLITLFNKVAKKSKLHIFTLDAKSIDSLDIEKFNDIATLNNWFKEQEDTIYLKKSFVSNQQEINNIISKYGTKYVLKTGIISIRQKNHSAILIPVSLIFCWPAIPFTIAATIKPKYDMVYYSYIADLTTGEKRLINFNYMKHKDTDVLVKSHLYSTFLDINKKGIQSRIKIY